MRRNSAAFSDVFNYGEDAEKRAPFVTPANALTRRQYRQNKYTVMGEPASGGESPIISEDVVFEASRFVDDAPGVYPSEFSASRRSFADSEWHREWRSIQKTLGASLPSRPEDNNEEDAENGETEEPFETPVREASFIEESKPTPLPEKVENQIISLMRKCVKQKKALERAVEQKKKLVSKIKTLHEQLKSAREDNEELQVELAHGGAGGGDFGSQMLRVRSQTGGGTMAKNAKLLESQKHRQEQRQKMFAALADGDDDDDDTLLGGGEFEDAIMGRCGSHIRRFRRFWRRNTPFRNDLIIIESRMGRSTASYFTFSRWLFINNIGLFVIQSVFLGFHMSALLTRGHQKMRLGAEDTVDKMALEWVAPQDIEWLQLEGGIPRWVSFSSYSAAVPGRGDAFNEPLLYSVVLVTTFTLLLIMIAYKWITEDKRGKLAAAFEGGSSGKRWSKFVFSSFDWSVSGKIAVDDQRAHFAGEVTNMMAEDQAREKGQTRTTKDKVLLWLRRFFIAIIYITIQASGWAGIVYLTVQSVFVKNYIGDSIGVKSSDLLLDPAAIAVSVINAANNAIVKNLVSLSLFDSHGTEIKAIVSLLFLSRTFNVAIQLGAYAQLVAPLMFLEHSTLGASHVKKYLGFDGELIRQTAKHFESDAFSCRFNQMGNQFFSLLVTDFLISKIIAISMLLLKLAAKKCQAKNVKRSSFSIPAKLVALCYNQQLSLISIVFLPCSSIFAMLFLFINFKFEKWISLNTQKKPKKAWAARDANGFYLRFYFISVALVMAAAHTMLSTNTLPKLCSVLSDSLPPFGEAKIAYAPPRSRSLGLPQTYSPPSDCDAESANGTLARRHNMSVALLCACSSACGPWVLSANGYAPILEWVSKRSIFSWMYYLLDNVHLWMFVAGCFYVVDHKRRNSIAVNTDVAEEAATASLQQRQAQARQIRKLLKKVKLQQRQIDAST